MIWILVYLLCGLIFDILIRIADKYPYELGRHLVYIIIWPLICLYILLFVLAECEI